VSHPDPWELYDFDETEYVDDLLDERSRDSVRVYLTTYGDAIESRVQECLTDAQALMGEGHYGLSLVRSATASELVIGYLVVRPLVQGAFLSEQWAAILTDRIIYASRRNSRELLPPLVKHWGIDLEAVALPSGGRLWDRVVGDDGVWRNRDGYLHLSRPVSREVAQTSIEAVDGLLTGLVKPIAMRLAMAWPEKPWSATAFPTVLQTIHPSDPIGER
jgi:hypothetical protein